MLRLVYIIPEYNAASASHFYHIYELLEKVSKDLDIFLVIEKGKTPTLFPNLKGVYLQRFSFPPFRFFELWVLLLYLRIRGWKNFWVHYSFYAAIAALDVNFFLGGKNFYWNCGMPWLYKRSSFNEMIFQFVIRYSTLVTGTDGMKKMYIKRYGLAEKNVKVIPNWINVERFREWQGRKEEARKALGIPVESRVVLFVHHLSQRKGADQILPTAKALQDIPNLLFLVVGDGPEYEHLKLGIMNLKLEGVVRLEGMVKNVNIPQYFVASDLLFMPSDEEGFPRVLLETMAVGTPFVASDVGGVLEMIPEETKEFICSPRNVDCFAKKIRELLAKQTPDNRKALSDLLVRFVNRYDIGNVAERFVQLVNL